jgi:hypothetical protein
VKANVLFLDRKPAREQKWTETLWIAEELEAALAQFSAIVEDVQE